MTTEALITRDDSAFRVQFTQEAHELRTAALECAALIGKVTNSTEQEQAVLAQKEIKKITSAVEDARSAAKKPVLDFGRAIDDQAKAFVAVLKAEELRIATLLGDFQTLELARTRAEEALRQKELNEIEQRTQEEIAKAISHDEIDLIQARASQEAAAVPLVTPRKAEGQVVKEDWAIIITNGLALANAAPQCVEIVPKVREIKALINSGVTLPGVVAKKVTKSQVRIGRELLAITI